MSQIPQRVMSAGGGADLLRVASYNVLAQCYVRSEYFPYSEPGSCLKWKNRSKALLRTVDDIAADVYLLQEIDQYSDFWEKEMNTRGYDGLYKQRTQHTNKKQDGCAIFYKRKKLKVLEVKTIEFNDLADLRCRSGAAATAAASALMDQESPQVAAEGERFLRDSVGILAGLQWIHAPETPLLFGSAHLFWNPAYADVKLAQAAHYRLHAAELWQRLKGAECAATAPDSGGGGSDSSDGNAGETRVPVILAGDFNSLPTSDVYACMTSTSGHDDADTLPALTSAYGTGLWMSAESEATQAAGSEGPTHSNGGGEVREPAFTTCTPTFTATIDYVFSWGVAPVRVRPLPARKSLGVGLPNGGHPSDHLPLVVDFCVEQQQQQ